MTTGYVFSRVSPYNNKTFTSTFVPSESKVVIECEGLFFDSVHHLNFVTESEFANWSRLYFATETFRTRLRELGR